MPVADLLCPGEVTLVRQHDAKVHHRRLDDQRRDLIRVALKHPLELRDVVERDHRSERSDLGRYALRLGHRGRGVSRAHAIRFWFHRDHQRVVVPVIRGLDLHDPVATCEPARQAHRIERRLGATVGEAPLRLVETPGEVLRHLARILDGLREMSAVLDSV